MESYLRSRGITKLYHFTSYENLNSIKRTGGLLSWKRCYERRLKYVGGGNSLSRDLDRRQGLEDYVRLSFCADHPMKYRLEQQGHSLFLLQIDLSILSVPGVKFSDMNATDSHATIQGGINGLKNVKLEATQRSYVRKDDEDFKYHQAEILVPRTVPLEYIKNL